MTETGEGKRISDSRPICYNQSATSGKCRQVEGILTSRLEYDRQAGEAAMKTQGEIEAAVCSGIVRFEQDYMGRGPKDIHAHLLGDLLVIRLKGVLTAAEQHLVQSLPAEKGRDLLKQVRTIYRDGTAVDGAMIEEDDGQTIT